MDAQLNPEGMHRSGIYVNDGYSLAKAFSRLIDGFNDPELCLYAVVGYFRSSGYFPLKESLKKLKKVRVVVGINADSLSVRWHRESREAKERMVREQAYRELCERIEQEGYNGETENGLKSFVDDVLAGRLELRAYAARVVHAKLYVFIPENWDIYAAKGSVITGSSNFTGPGLGTDAAYNEGNYELNLERRDAATIEFAKGEFDRFWKESVSLIPTEIAEVVRKKTFINQDITPRDFYYRFLYEVFKDTIETEGTGIENFFPQGFKRLSYQIDAVNEGLDLLERHHGFFLADVVGLGKTVVSTILTLRWLSNQPKEARVLVVAPPVLMRNWARTFDSFHLSEKKFHIVSSGSLHKIENPSSYALIIVDEAHNFRNSNTEAYTQLNELCKMPGDLGRKKVILVSATPLNNHPRELLNLIKLFQDERNSTLSVTDLQAFFSERQKAFDEAKKAGVDVKTANEKVKEIYREIRELVLSDITIRRTRNDLKENKLYAKDLADQGIVFPETQSPRTVPYYLDSDVDALFTETLEILAGEDGLHYAYHKMLDYVRGPAREKFNLPENAFVQLKRLIVQFFLKRLDSSFHAFRSSLNRFKDDTAALMTMLDAGTVYYSNSIDVRQFIANEDIAGLEAEIELKRASDPSITTLTPEDFSPDFHTHLHDDLEKLFVLAERWEAVTEDPKLEMFASQIDGWLKKEKNPGERLVVFSESEDTVIMIRDYLEKHGRTDVLAVSAANRNETISVTTGSNDEEMEVEELIRRNFDANYPHSLKESRYRIIVTTDVLSEGVNLHRANTIVNYDTPWNSVRLFQRIGRVNRVGSVADKIFIYNFFPMSRVDDVIELKKKAQMKLQAFHSAFGEDAPIYSSDEEVEHFGLYGSGSAEDSEAANPKLKLMMEIRELAQENPAEFERIKGLPAHMRCVRASAAPMEPMLYLSTSSKDLFYRVGETEARQLTLMEAAGILRTDADETPSHGEFDWDALIARASAVYEREESIKEAQTTAARKYPVHVRNAINYVDSFLNTLDTDILSREDIELFSKAIDLIRNGSAPTRLVQEIGKSEKNAFNLSDALKAGHLKELFERFDIANFTNPAHRQNDLELTREAARFVMGEAWTKGSIKK